MSGGGGSLGQRTGSYGSLLQQQLESSFVFPIHTTATTTTTTTTPPLLRKPYSKMVAAGAREKERLLSRICKLLCRRRVGMLLLVSVSVVVFMSVLSAVSKEDEAREVSIVDSHHRSTKHIEDNVLDENISISYPESSVIIERFDKKDEFEDRKEDNSSNFVTLKSENNALPLLPVAVKGALAPGHPCERFALPHLQPIKKGRVLVVTCPVCYLPVEQAIASMPSAPSISPLIRNLAYVYEENSVRTDAFGGSEFGGYPTLKQRNDSYDIKETMNVHCGFVKGAKPGRQTGFDIGDADLSEMEQCYGIVVASAIFGNYDIIQQPKNISEYAKQNVCFYMFVDEETEAYFKNSSVLDEKMKVGLWRVVVVHNLPYTDARRNGKVPKLLLHRIFPNARYSIWIDGKLELVVDPFRILERFLWRNGATFAISRHYRRFDVFQEAEANKAAGKYENASIDFQVDFYKMEGLTPYSEAKLPITSDVPEGCVIIREHIPITNLFTCLWFNEVDRFTSRDQLSFAMVRDKIMSKVSWSVNMFLDCERRNFVVQAYHRDLLEHMAPPISAAILEQPESVDELPVKSSADPITDQSARTPGRKIPTKRGRERRSGSRRHRKTSAGVKEPNSI
ncbi:hypothetical protein Syun_008438 [Stephania yunnanensis]|uniref:TOD1/MUCI70 glycosyltransferase-like domain-containing protein n=1 Tax=Stephania yunnanensis TaxID=152371 RepID=A0AAP0PPL6_9MAGN